MSECNSAPDPIVSRTKLVKNLNGLMIDHTLYKQIVGSLMYLTTTRPNIMFVVSFISRYMEHLKVAKKKKGC